MSKIKNVLLEAASPAVNTAKVITAPRFRKKLDLSADAIKDGSDEYKRECVTRVENRRGVALKFSTVFTVAALCFLILYGFINSYATLGRQDNPLGRLDVVQIFLPVMIFPSLVAVFMKPKAIILTILLYAAMAAYFIVIWHFLVVVPIAIAGCVIYIRLSRVVDAFYILSEQKGYPDFMTLSEDIVNKEFIEREKQENLKNQEDQENLNISENSENQEKHENHIADTTDTITPTGEQ
jgi:hypothetical protein